MLANGTVIDGKYEILSKVGQGGMSVVYLALNRKAMKQWAIKEVRRDGVKDFEVVKQSLVAETDMLKKLSHPNLPDIVDIIENDDSFFIVMDYIEGKPLSKRLEESGAQPEEYVVEWAKQLCDVLDYLHTRTPAIIYRDMKPSNVMLKPDGTVCLIDFGTAREYKGTNIQDTTCLGTIGYAAPEQFGGKGETDARTDIYCLGATLYHLVTGHSPADPPYEMYPIRQWNETLSPGLEAIILKCIQKDPNDRYQSCAELKYALENMEENTRAYWVKQKKRLNIFIASVIATIVCLCVGLFGTIMGNVLKKSNYDYYIAKADPTVETGKYAVEDYKKAFATEYMSDSADNLATYFNNYMQAYIDNDSSAVITADELNEFESALGTSDASNETKYIDEIENNLDAYVVLNYNIGLKLLQFAEGEEEKARYAAAKPWFVRANTLQNGNKIDIDRLGNSSASAAEESKIDYELAQTLNEVIVCWDQIDKANTGDSVVGETVNYAEVYKTIENAVNSVLGRTISNDGAKLKIYEVFANFLVDGHLVDQFVENGGSKANALSKWNEVVNELQAMQSIEGAKLELKQDLLEKDAVIQSNLKD